MLSFEDKLDNYAQLIVEVGVNIQEGQNLMLRAPVEGAYFARRVVEAAYKAGARFVDVIWSDEATLASMFRYAPDDVLTETPAWQVKALTDAAGRSDAYIDIRATDPELLKQFDSERVAAFEKSRRAAIRPFSQAVMNSALNWCLVTMPVTSWAHRLFSQDDEAAAKEKLWNLIFKAVRADLDDPVGVWKTHLENLEERRRYLTVKQYDALIYKSPSTDLTVGLPKGHLWLGGIQPTNDGIVYVANLPTEEVFTLPHKDRVDGVVRSTKPLAYAGNIIDDFELTFEKGRVISAKAGKGEETLQQILNTDEGAKRLGEVALVPHSSPISQMDTLFYNTLYDENAASHLALGRAYRFTLDGGTTMTDDEASAAGANDSLTHVDFMIGSAETNIDGVLADGSREAIMRNGEWAF